MTVPSFSLAFLVIMSSLNDFHKETAARRHQYTGSKVGINLLSVSEPCLFLDLHFSLSLRLLLKPLGSVCSFFWEMHTMEGKRET